MSYESNPDLEPASAATGYLGRKSGVTPLDPEHWQEIEGSYQGLDSFSVSIDMGDRFEGTGIRADGSYRNLGPDEFLVKGEMMTVVEFRRLVAAAFPCSIPTGSRAMT